MGPTSRLLVASRPNPLFLRSLSPGGAIAPHRTSLSAPTGTTTSSHSTSSLGATASNPTTINALLRGDRTPHVETFQFKSYPHSEFRALNFVVDLTKHSAIDKSLALSSLSLCKVAPSRTVCNLLSSTMKTRDCACNCNP